MVKAPTQSQIQTILRRFGACGEATKWANGKATKAAWGECQRGDWLLWISARANVDRKLVVAAACRCARLALKHVKAGEDRPRLAIEAAEAWTRGERTIEEVRKAAAYAYAAYAAAAYAAYAAAYAAADAAAAADADAAYAAAYAAADADAAYAAAYAAAARDKAREETLAKCADLVRETISYRVVMDAIKRSSKSA
jgi:hypothetical protein